mgnify:CR=1 FL=1
MTRLTAVAACLAAALILAGCAEPRPLPTPTPTATEAVESTGDGVLRIGALLSMGGDVTTVSPGMVAAIEVAARDINAAGGVLGVPVETFYRDAGAIDSDQLEAGFAELVARGVDVVVGPAAPALLERLLPLAAEAGVVVLASAAPSPTVGSATPAGSLVRTIPAVDRQAVAIAQSLVDDRVGSIAVIAATDAQGLTVVDSVRAVLDGSTTSLTAVERADGNTTPNRLAFSVASAEPDTIIVAADRLTTQQTADIVAALLDRGVRAEQLWFTSTAVADYSTTLPGAALDGTRGVREGADAGEQFTVRLLQSDPRLDTVRFAAETYDAVVLAALAATIAEDDGGVSIARAIRTAMTGGVVCGSFGECLDALDNDQTVNYDGVSGPLDIDEVGDIVGAELSVLRYDASNRPQPDGALSLRP